LSFYWWGAVMNFALNETATENTIAVLEDLSEIPLAEIACSAQANHVINRVIDESGDSSFGTASFNSFIGAPAGRLP
jgi:hypothetical protein